MIMTFMPNLVLCGNSCVLELDVDHVGFPSMFPYVHFLCVNLAFVYLIFDCQCEDMSAFLDHEIC